MASEESGKYNKNAGRLNANDVIHTDMPASLNRWTIITKTIPIRQETIKWKMNSINSGHWTAPK